MKRKLRQEPLPPKLELLARSLQDPRLAAAFFNGANKALSQLPAAEQAVIDNAILVAGRK
jgi:hypothetical protein